MSKLKTCPTCHQSFPESCFVGYDCYLCTLEKGYTNGFSKALYRKAVAVALALKTPLTVKQARKVVRKAWVKYPGSKMEVLNNFRIGNVVSHEPAGTYYQRVMEVVR